MPPTGYFFCMTPGLPDRRGAVDDEIAPPRSYWVGVALILLAGLITAVFLPYKYYSLDFGDFGKVCLKATRFSGLQEIKLDDHWHSLNGIVIPSSESGQVALVITTVLKTSEGLKVEVTVHNPTAWRIHGLIIGFAQRGLPNRDQGAQSHVALVNCRVDSFSIAELSVPVSLDTDTTTLKLLSAVGVRQEY
jgi:hypothetical protein